MGALEIGRSATDSPASSISLVGAGSTLAAVRCRSCRRTMSAVRLSSCCAIKLEVSMSTARWNSANASVRAPELRRIWPVWTCCEAAPKRMRV